MASSIHQNIKKRSKNLSIHFSHGDYRPAYIFPKELQFQVIFFLYFTTYENTTNIFATFTFHAVTFKHDQNNLYALYNCITLMALSTCYFHCLHEGSLLSYKRESEPWMKKKQRIIRCNHRRLRRGGGMQAGTNIPFI